MVTSIEQQYIDLHPKSLERYEKSRTLFPNGVTHDARNLKPFPYFVSHAEGAYKWDVDGHRITDFRSGHGSLLLGHGHPDVVRAVQEQMARGTHFSASTDIEIQWAELVCELVPCAEKVRFQSSGTESDMMAMRMARAYTGKSKIIKFENHFHGWSDYATVGAPSGLGGIPGETLSTMIVLPNNDIAAVEKAIVESGDVAGVIIEPTGAHMGHDPLKAGYLQALRDVTKKHGVVLIFDEVVTGFRISRGGASGYFGIVPDLSTHAKILGGGLPAGCVAGKADIIDMLQLRDDPEFNKNRRVAHNGTFNANPLSAAAGVTALNIVNKTDANEQANRTATYLKDSINSLLARKEVVGFADGLASAIFVRFGIEGSSDADLADVPATKLKAIYSNPARDQAVLAMFNKGIDGWDRFLVGIKHTNEDVDETVAAMDTTIDEMRGEGLI